LRLPEKDWFRPDEVAKYWGVAVSTIYSWIDQGVLEGHKICGKPVRISRSEIEKKPVSTLSV